MASSIGHGVMKPVLTRGLALCVSLAGSAARLPGGQLGPQAAESAVNASCPWKMFDRRVGMFVHWGIYSVGGYHEQERMRLGVSRAEYAKYAERFTAEKFDADKFVDAAESLGAEYIVFTAKHHDGFCLWDTKTTGFNVMNTPAGRDVVGELAAACRRRGMKFGLYYSNPDWNHPNGYNALSSHQVAPEPDDCPNMKLFKEYVKEQVTELMTNYGEICCLFWDIPTQVEEPEMNALVRRLQPNIMIDDRGWGSRGDYSTPERGIPDGAAFSRPTEACDSVGARSWGFRLGEDYRTLGYTSRSIDHILTMGGNFLLNVGPKPDGTIPDEALDVLKRTGDWYRKVRESYRGVATEPWLVACDGVMATRRGDTVYVHCPKGLLATGLDLMPIAEKPTKATLLNTGADVAWEMARLPGHPHVKRDFLHLKDLPADALANESTVIRLDFEKEPEAVLLEARGFTARKDRSAEPDASSVRMLRLKDKVRLEFSFEGEDGAMDEKTRRQALRQEAYGDPRGGDFALGGEAATLHVSFGVTGRIWKNVRRNFRTASVFADGKWTFTIDIPLDAIPRMVGDSGAFLANFHRKAKTGVYSWRCDPSVPLDSVQGGALVRLEQQAPTVGYFRNPLDARHDFRACWTKDFHRVWLEEKGGEIAGAFRLVNTNRTQEVYFHNGRVGGATDCFVPIPAAAANVVCTLKAKGRGDFRFGFMPWTADKCCLYPFERTARECHLDSPDEWQTIRCGFVPEPDGVYAENAAYILPSLWLAASGDILVDDMEIRFLNESVENDAEPVAFPSGLPLSTPPMAAATPSMRGAFVPDEWRDAMAVGKGVLAQQDGRMTYVAAETDGYTPLALSLKGSDGAPFAVAVTLDGAASSSSKRPVYAFVNVLPNGKTVFRLALPKNLCAFR